MELKELKKLNLSEKYVPQNQKRKHARIPVEIKGTYIYQDINNKVFDKCLINSLSTGGLSLMTGVVLLKGDVIVVNFPLGEEMISEYCKVTRTHGKEVGCKFINPVKRNEVIIQNYIHNRIF